MNDSIKIVGVGFHKTGTTTLGDCFQYLGYKRISANRKAFIHYHKNNISKVMSIMEKYKAFEDWPWALVYKEAYNRFPNSKFILTRRKDESIWFDSLNKHVERGDGKGFHYRKYIYGYDMPSDNRTAHIERYLQHNADVKAFFSDKEDSFLEICWEEGDSWEKLCSFLGEEVPDISVPHSNSRSKESRVPLTKKLLEFYYSLRKF